ncbi:MAG: membrane protein [Bacteroidales bacterium]
MMEKKLEFAPRFRFLTYGMMLIGIAGLAVGFASDPVRGWANLLMNNFYFLSLAIGASFFLALQYISQSGWSAAFKRIPESVSMYIPVAGIIMIILIFGMNQLYSWIEPERFGFDEHELHLIHHKAPYLNKPFFIVRLVLYFVVWVSLTQILRRFSLREDLEGGLEYFRKSEFYSKVYIFSLALTFSLASFDWVMTLEPTWYSTIFSLKNFVAAFYHGSAVIVLIVLVLHTYGYFDFINEAHWQDFSKYVFILSIMWAYFWFSQYLLIWYANIPEETTYYVERLTGPWKINFYTNLVLNWVVPFVILLPNYFARKKFILAGVIILTLIGFYTDLFEQIMPSTVGEFHIGFIEVATFIGFTGLFIYIFMRTLSSANLIPVKHPLLDESLHHTGH